MTSQTALVREVLERDGVIEAYDAVYHLTDHDGSHVSEADALAAIAAVGLAEYRDGLRLERAEDALEEAAQNVTDRRTLMDDGYWVSQRDMNALDAALLDGRKQYQRGIEAALAAVGDIPSRGMDTLVPNTGPDVIERSEAYAAIEALREKGGDLHDATQNCEACGGTCRVDP